MISDKTFAESREEVMANVGKGSRIIVLAPTKEKAEFWRRLNDVKPGDVLYASSSHIVEGVRACAVVILFGFWRRKDAFEIEDVVERGCLSLARDVPWFYTELI